MHLQKAYMRMGHIRRFRRKLQSNKGRAGKKKKKKETKLLAETMPKHECERKQHFGSTSRLRDNCFNCRFRCATAIRGKHLFPHLFHYTQRALHMVGTSLLTMHYRFLDSYPGWKSGGWALSKSVHFWSIRPPSKQAGSLFWTDSSTNNLPTCTFMLRISPWVILHFPCPSY